MHRICVMADFVGQCGWIKEHADTWQSTVYSQCFYRHWAHLSSAERGTQVILHLTKMTKRICDLIPQRDNMMIRKKRETIQAQCGQSPCSIWGSTWKKSAKFCYCLSEIRALCFSSPWLFKLQFSQIKH